MQATRNGLFAIEENDTTVVYTPKHDSQGYVIVAAIGKDKKALLFQTAKALYDQSGKPVVIKNVNQKLGRALLENGCRHYYADEWWDPWFKYDDNTFPEQVLDTKEVLELKGKEFQKIRNEMNTFKRKHVYEVRKADKLDSSQIIKLAAHWARNLNERNFVGEKFLIESVKMFFDKNEHLVHFEVIDTDTKALIGLLAFSEISSNCMAANLLLNDFSYRNSSRIFMIEGARCVGQLGYTYLNTQGSEDTNQHLAKRMLKPAKQIFKTHLVFDSRSCAGQA